MSHSDVVMDLSLPYEIGFKDFRHEWEERSRRANIQTLGRSSKVGECCIW